MNFLSFPIDLYCKTPPRNVETLDLVRGEDDFRKVFIVDTDTGKFVIKHTSNSFTSRDRIEGWQKLAAAYRSLGIYCPSPLPDLNGNFVYHYEENGRDYYVYAEEFAKYETAEQKDKKEISGYTKNIWQPDALYALGKVANARLAVMEHPSAYCLLEPFCPSDKTDEAKECADGFTACIQKDFPGYAERALSLLTLFNENREKLREIYPSLPTSCFQADMGSSNVLVDDSGAFMGLIDFNLCGREPVLNYAVRAALWLIRDPFLRGENGSCLYFYDEELDNRRNRLFLKNTGYIQKAYTFSNAERAAFPVLFRYMNTYWWHHIDELKLVKEEPEKVGKILDWLEHQMTRDDLRLP